MKCVIYGRVSTNKEEQKNSLENQISLGERIAKEHGFTIVDRYIDNGLSGTGFKNRSEINRLLDDSKKKKFNVVIAKSVSRLGRDMLMSLKLAHELEKEDIRLILPEDSYDTETSSSRLMFNLKAIFAEEESIKLSERTKYGLRERANKGKYTASVPPYGYCIDRDTSTLKINDETAPIVKEIFNLYLYQGKGLFTISNLLTRRGVLPPRAYQGIANAGLKWQQSTLKLILNNPVYTGKLVHCKEVTTNRLAKSELYKERKKVNEDMQVIIENAHPAIISEEDYLNVQLLMKKRGKDKTNGKESLFAHIAKCADCGSGMHFKPDRRKGAYVCGGYVKHTSSYCSSHIIEERLLLKAVKEDIQDLIANTVKLENLYGIAEKKTNTIQSSITKELKQIDRQIDKLNNQFRSLLSLHSEGVISTEQFKEQNTLLSSQQQDLANKKMELNALLEKKNNSAEEYTRFKKEIENFAKLDIQDENILKQVLQRLIDKIEVFESGKIKIHYNLSSSHSS